MTSKDPGYTKIPDVILDEWLAELSGAEIRIILLVARKTYGWRKSADKISTAQIADGTGLVRSTVIKTCTELEQKGYLLCTPSDLPNGHPKAVNTYSLNTNRNAEKNVDSTSDADAQEQDASASDADGDTVTRPKNRPVQKSDGSKNRTGTGLIFGRVAKGQPVRKSDPQQTEQTALQTAATHATASSEKSCAEPTSPASVDAPFAAALAHSNIPSTEQTSETKPVQPAPLPGPDVCLLDYADADLDRLRKTNPGELVRRFRAQNPAYTDRMAKKAQTAHTSANPLLARCIVEDWLPQVRSERDVPKPAPPAPYKPPANPKLPAAFRARHAEKFGTSGVEASVH